jgi:zinc protease
MRSPSACVVLVLAAVLSRDAGAQTSGTAVLTAGSTGILAADTATTMFEVNGLRVIVRRNTANDVVAANLYLLGGTGQLTPATQGIETLLLAASERGTKNYPREQVRQKTATLGSSIIVSPLEDWTLFGFTAINSTFDSTWAIFADRLMAPTLDSAEVELVRERILAGVRQRDNTPEPEVTHLADSLQYVGHPYSFAPEGNESSLQSITLDALRNYHTKAMVTSRMLLVVVGNVDRAKLQSLVERTIGTLPRGNYAWSPPIPPPKLGRGLVTRTMALPTNYIVGYYTGPGARHPDYQALRVACAVLSGRFFTEIRSKRNLSYEVEAPFLERAVASGGVYVTTVDPNATLRLMQSEITRLKSELIDPRGLERLIQQFITDYFLKNETNADQATFLARAAIYQGDYRVANSFVESLRRVTPEDVRRVARQYMRDFRFAYLGNPDKLSKEILEQF